MSQSNEAIVAVEAAQSDTRKSVVAQSYKIRYAERAVSARGKKGVDKKVVADSCGDWLALELAALVRPTKKSKLDVKRFCDILEANGIDPTKWCTPTPNWQGRLRMTGGLALRAIVAEAGEMAIPSEDGITTIRAPKAWCDRWLK